MSPEPCTFLEWDSEFFGFRIGRVNANRLVPDTLATILDWCAQNEIRALYFLADIGHRDTIRLAEGHDFYLVDVRMRFEVSFARSRPPAETQACHLVLPEDVPGLTAIAQTAYHDTRFYYDEHFPEQACSRLYEVWIEKSIAGYADGVLVIGEPGQPQGYVTCHLDRAAQHGKIGLVGVDAACRGQGIGTRLLSGALTWFAEQGMATVEVVTQGRNLSAQKLYQRSGFITADVKAWYHHWFTDQPQP